MLGADNQLHRSTGSVRPRNLGIQGDFVQKEEGLRRKQQHEQREGAAIVRLRSVPGMDYPPNTGS